MILLTGATGYIGGRLLRALERQSMAVRCLCRNPEVLRGRVAPGTQVVPGDLFQPASLGPAFAGVETAFYLVHAMQSGREFERLESEAARNFARAACERGVRRIVFLGGLAHGNELSPHMRSRLETGKILRASGVPVVELRASIVIGSGSASFELIRALVERLPVMVTPRWVHTAAQPIGIEDVVTYLVEAIEVEAQDGLIVEIGGADVTSYLGIMREYSRQRKLRRWFLAVPFLSPGLSSRWLTLVTPVYASIGRFLIESVRTPSVVRRPEAGRAFKVRPVGHAQAVERALTNEDLCSAETRWSDAGCPAVWAKAAEPGPAVLSNVQEVRVPLSPAEAFAPVRRIGGRTGWYFGNWLWKVRGLLDLMTGGVGMRRGRPDPETPVTGSTLDFWRVRIYEPGHRLRLVAEMRVPGRAWLEFRAEAQGRFTVLRQIACFEPCGLIGLLYWYLLWPIHEVMFRGMLQRIAAAALDAAAPGKPTVPPSNETGMKMVRILSFLPVAALAAEPAAEIKIGERLPELHGELLTGRRVVFPQAAEGRVTLLLLGFTYKSRFAVEAWAQSFRAQYQSDPRVTFCEAPIIGGVARLAKWFIDSGMRRGTPQDDYEHVVTVYGRTDTWKQRVRFDDPDAAYLILLDHTGKVAWRYQGAFEDEAFQALSRKTRELASTI